MCHMVTNGVNIPDKDWGTSLVTLTVSCSDPSEYAAMKSSSYTMRFRMSVGKTEVRNPICASVPNKALYGICLMPE